MSRTAYQRSKLKGGDGQSLDGPDGDTLLDGDFAFVSFRGLGTIRYILDADSGLPEKIPFVIPPALNPGLKRWILQGHEIFIDPTVADQTKITTEQCRSVQDIIVAADSTTKVTITLSPLSINETTNYNFLNDLDIPRHIDIRIGLGAIMNVDSTAAVDIDGELFIGRYQTFSQTGTITFGKNCPNNLYPEMWGAIIGEGEVDSTIPLQLTANAMDNRTVDLAASVGGYYKITSAISPPTVRSWTINGNGSRIQQFTNNTPILEIGRGVWTHHWFVKNVFLTYNENQTKTDVNSYGIAYCKDDGVTGSGIPYFGQIERVWIQSAYRGIGILGTPGQQIAPWMITVRDTQITGTIGAGIYYVSPKAVGMPNNSFRHVYVSYRHMTYPRRNIEPGFVLHVQTEATMDECAVEESYGCAVALQTMKSININNLHIESATLNDEDGLDLIKITQSNVTFNGGDFSGMGFGVDTTSSEGANIFLCNVPGDTYNKVIINNIREQFPVNTGDLHFIKTGSYLWPGTTYYSRYHVEINGCSTTYCADWYKKYYSVTGAAIDVLNGVSPANQDAIIGDSTSCIISTVGLTELIPTTGDPLYQGLNKTYYLPDGEISGQKKTIRKESEVGTANVIVEHHKEKDNREFFLYNEGDYIMLEWVDTTYDSSQWITIGESTGVYQLAGPTTTTLITTGTTDCLNATDGTGYNCFYTLDDGQVYGQRKTIRKCQEYGTTTVTISHHRNGNNWVISLPQEYDYIILEWAESLYNYAQWITVEESSGLYEVINDNGNLHPTGISDLKTYIDEIPFVAKDLTVTLPDGKVHGQMKTIRKVSTYGTAYLTITSHKEGDDYYQILIGDEDIIQLTWIETKWWGNYWTTTYKSFTTEAREYSMHKVIDLSTPAKLFTISSGATNEHFIPTSVYVKTTSIITATDGDYLSVGVDDASRRIDFGVSDNPAVDGTHAMNIRFVYLDTPDKSSVEVAPYELIRLMSVDGNGDAANLGQNIGGPGESIMVIIKGLMITAA